MAPSIQSAIGSFVGSVSHIGSSILQAILGIFGAFLALGQALLGAVLQTGQAFLKLGADLFQSVAGFIFANIFLLSILGGGYYLWSTRSGSSGMGGKKRR